VVERKHSLNLTKPFFGAKPEPSYQPFPDSGNTYRTLLFLSCPFSETYSFVKGTNMPFNKRDPNQDVLMADIMSEAEEDPGMVKPEGRHRRKKSTGAANTG
jgi:hypothetical protein